MTTTVDNTSPITWTGDRKTNVFGLSGGTEAKLAQNVTLGAALKYINTSVKTVMNGTYTMTNVAFVDNNSDGSINGADAKVTNTNNSTWTNSIETKVNTLQIPIGLEMQVVKGLNARLGATHTVTDTTTTNAANATDLNRIKTETETAIVGGTATTKTYVNADGTQTFNNTTQTAHTVSHSTAYYFGAGYVWSENLSFDILCNANLVNLASWKIGATLSFLVF